MISPIRERVAFITTEGGVDLIVAYAIGMQRPGEVASLILQRTPKYEGLLPAEEQGVVVSHEAYPDDESERLRRVAFRGSSIDIVSTTRTYLLDASDVEPDELAAAAVVLKQMHAHGGFQLDLE